MTTGLFADFAGPKGIYGGQYPLADYKWLYTKKNGKVNFNVNSNVILAEVPNSQKSYAKKMSQLNLEITSRIWGLLLGCIPIWLNTLKKLPAKKQTHQ